MPIPIDLTGRIFGQLTVVEYVGQINEHRYWKCKCSCGNEITRKTCHLRHWGAKHCGCIKKNTCRKKVNDDYFKSADARVYYWAGFIAADGCISRNRLMIEIQQKDEELLQNLRNDLNYEGKVQYRTRVQQNGTISKMVKLQITSDAIVNDLAKIFKITPRKSHTLLFPEIISDDLALSYIKGYIDGDGCISRTKAIKNRKMYTIVSACSGSKLFVLGISKRIHDLSGTPLNIALDRGGKYYYIKFIKEHREVLVRIRDSVSLGLKRKWDLL